MYLSSSVDQTKTCFVNVQTCKFCQISDDQLKCPTKPNPIIYSIALLKTIIFDYSTKTKQPSNPAYLHTRPVPSSKLRGWWTSGGGVLISAQEKKVIP